MAFDLLKTVKHIEGLNNAQFRVLFYLLESANSRTFECFPSMKEISRFTGMSERTVQRHISDLADRGLFERVEQRRRDGSRAVNLYRFIVSGTVKVGNQAPIEIKAEEPVEQPAIFGGLMPEQPASFDGGPPSPVTGHISGITSQESYTPLSFGEGTPTSDSSKNFQLALTSEDPRSVPLMDFIAAEWKKLADEFDKIPTVKVWTNSRTDLIKRRTKEYLEKSGEHITPHDVWARIFQAIRNDDWLRGEAPPSRGYTKSFAVDIDHILRTNKIAIILEKDEINAQRNRATHSATTGRRFGPAEQAGRAVLARLGHGQEPGA